MTSAEADGKGHLADVVLELPEVRPCKRLQVVAALLVIIAVLGLAVTVAIVTTPSGEGLGSLLDRTKADVMGQVKEADGTPLDGATVMCVKNGRTSETGISGWYFLEDLPTGRVELRMEAEGYNTVLQTVSIERGQYVVDIIATPGVGQTIVDGKAVPKAGDPSKGASIMALGIGAVSVLALIGAYLAYLHRRYPVVLAACLLGTLTWGWFAGSALAIIALLLLLPLRREFHDTGPGCEAPWHEPPPPGLEDVGHEDEGATEEPRREEEPAPTSEPGGMPPVS
jgi:hypothetical protein